MGAFPMKPFETATRASVGHERNQFMVQPFTSPGNFRARSGNLRGGVGTNECKATVVRGAIIETAQPRFKDKLLGIKVSDNVLLYSGRSRF